MTRLLMLLCGLLLAGAAVELTHKRDHGAAPGTDVPGAGRTAAALLGSTGQAMGMPDQWAGVMLARPLFAPDRKPTGDAVAAKAGLPRLTGIIASAEEAMAIFQPDGSARPVVARHGDTIAGWQVTTVAVDAVSLRKANDRIVLRPRFTGAETLGATGEAKQPAPRWESAATSGLLRARWSNPQLQP